MRPRQQRRAAGRGSPVPRSLSSSLPGLARAGIFSRCRMGGGVGGSQAGWLQRAIRGVWGKKEGGEAKAVAPDHAASLPGSVWAENRAQESASALQRFPRQQQRVHGGAKPYPCQGPSPCGGHPPCHLLSPPDRGQRALGAAERSPLPSERSWGAGGGGCHNPPSPFFLQLLLGLALSYLGCAKAGLAGGAPESLPGWFLSPGHAGLTLHKPLSQRELSAAPAQACHPPRSP